MNKYKLNSGDIIKIGRITLRIRDIHFSSTNNNNNNNNNALNNSENGELNTKELNTLRTEANNGSRNYMMKKVNYLSKSKNKGIKQISLTKNLINKIEKKNKVCRICYVEEDDPDNNPLVQPCLCSGSMKYIHLSCLKHWISTRSCEKIDTTTYCIVYIIKPVECELCKTKFPDLIKHNGKYHHLLDFSKDFESYLTLESLTLDKYKNKFIYTISLENSGQKLKLGRGHDCDILLSDISVSRIHCYLLTDKMNKNLFLIDNDSFKLFDCCHAEEFSNIFYYFEQNEKKVNQHINLIIKSDEDNDIIGDNSNLENKTCEQKYPDKINGEYTYDKNEVMNNKSKITDNEYFRVRHIADNKNLGDTLIDDNKDSLNEEEKENINLINKSDNENKNSQIDNNEENKNNDENDNDNDNENDNYENNINYNEDECQIDDVDENDATIQ